MSLRKFILMSERESDAINNIRPYVHIFGSCKLNFLKWIGALGVLYDNE